MPNIIDEKQRWRWWYEAISDWMIANPGGKLGDCALALNKAQSTISMIVNSQLFKDYHAQRRQAFREQHDEAIVAKTTKVAELGLDLILERMTTKRDAIPLGVVKDLTDSALSRLGYGTPKAGVPMPGGTTIINGGNVVQVSAQDLAEARALVRSQEQQRLALPARQPVVAPPVAASEGEREGEVSNAPLP